MNSLVSVVIPTFNYGGFVGRAVDSVLAQTHAPLECVVVDDGSTDDTPTVLARYGSRIRVIRQENRGLSAARNAGVREARGAYVALLDADDFWRPNKVEKQVALMQSTPGLGAVGCGAEYVNRDGSHRSFQHFEDPPSEVGPRLRAIATRRYWVGSSGSGALVPRRAFDEVGLFDENLRAAEDWDMWLRIAARFAIRNVPEALSCICLHGTGSFRNAEKMEKNQWAVFEAAVRRWPDLLDAPTRRRMRALILADAGGEYAFGKAYGAALRRYLASLKEWPLHGRHWYRVARLVLKQVGV